VTVYWGDSSETWTGTSSTTTIAATAANKVKAGDMNGDGYLDLAVACYSTSGSADSFAFLNTGGRTFGSTPDMRLSGSEYTSCQVGDIDDDGYADIVFGMGAASHTQEVKAFYGGPSGPSPSDSLLILADRCYDLMLKDLDGDGSSTSSRPATRAARYRSTWAPSQASTRRRTSASPPAASTS